MEEQPATDDQELRERAVERLKKKSEFRSHLTSFLLVNAFLVGIWAFTGQGYFWPIWPILGWGVGVGFHAWDTYGRPSSGPSEEQIRREIDKLR
jgi:2TM domain-containing protein